MGLDNDPDSREYDGDPDDELSPSEMNADEADDELDHAVAGADAILRSTASLEDSSYVIGGSGAAGSCGPSSPPVALMSPAGNHVYGLDEVVGRLIPDIHTLRESRVPLMTLQAIDPVGIPPESPADKPAPEPKLYARGPLSTGSETYRNWLEVADIIRIPADWEIMSATGPEDLCAQLNAARGGTKEQQYAVVAAYGNYDGRELPGTRTPSWQQQVVREYATPRYLGRDLDIFLQLVRRDGGMRITADLQTECQRRIQEEGRQYVPHSWWHFNRYLHELGYAVQAEGHGVNHYVTYAPAKAAKQAQACDETYNPTIAARLRAERQQQAGLQLTHVTDFVTAMANELLWPSEIPAGTTTFRDPRPLFDGACRSKEGWCIWLAHYLRLHNAVVGPEQFRTMFQYEAMVDQWRRAPQASLKAWAKCPDLIRWMQWQVRLRTEPPKRKDLSQVGRGLYKFKRGK